MRTDVRGFLHLINADEVLGTHNRGHPGRIPANPQTRVVTWTITYDGLSGPVTMAHLHGPAAEGKNGPVVIWLAREGGRSARRAVGSVLMRIPSDPTWRECEWLKTASGLSQGAHLMRGSVS